MPKVLKDDIKIRAHELRSLGKEQYNKFLSSQIGSVQNVLIEKNGSGHTPNFSKILLNENVNSGEIISAEIIDSNSKGLIGKVSSKLISS